MSYVAPHMPALDAELARQRRSPRALRTLLPVIAGLLIALGLMGLFEPEPLPSVLSVEPTPQATAVVQDDEAEQLRALTASLAWDTLPASAEDGASIGAY